VFRWWLGIFIIIGHFKLTCKKGIIEKGGILTKMELKLAKEGTEYILGLPIKPAFFSQVISHKEGTIEHYSSLEEAKRARDEVAKEQGLQRLKSKGAAISV